MGTGNYLLKWLDATAEHTHTHLLNVTNKRLHEQTNEWMEGVSISLAVYPFDNDCEYLQWVNVTTFQATTATFDITLAFHSTEQQQQQSDREKKKKKNERNQQQHETPIYAITLA